MNKILSIAIVLIVVAAFSSIGGLSILALIDVPSLLFIAGVVFAGIIFSFGPSMALRVFFPFGLEKLAEDGVKRDLYSCALRRASKLSYAAALLGFMTGAIAILGAWSETAHPGPGFAVALVCPFYSVLLSAFLFDGTRTSVDSLGITPQTS